MLRAMPLALALVLTACGPAGEPPGEFVGPAQDQETERVWPQPPAAPRIKFLGSFREPEDLGVRPSFFGRLWDAIAGEEVQGMVRPYGLAVQGGRIAVADPGLRAVHIFDLENETYRRLSEVGNDALRSPVGVAFGPERLYIADSDRAQVFALDNDGDLVFAIEGAERPTGLAYDPVGDRLYVADTLGHRILVFDDAGNSLFSFGQRGDTDGEFNYPSHLALRAGRLYVNDTMNFRLQVFDLNGRHIASFGRHGDGSGDFAQSKGIAVDPEGHVYVADALFDRVQIFGADGNYLLAFGGPGRGPGDFWLPGGVFIDGDRVYVADSYNQRIQVFKFLGGG